MPIIVACGLIAARHRQRRTWPGAAIFPSARTIDAKAIVLILGGLAALIAIIGLDGGFIPATAVLFAATAAAFGRRAILTDLAIGFVLSRRGLSGVRQAADACRCRWGRSSGCSDMDALAALAQGLTVALQPMNLLFALIGVLLGTAVGVLPGIGPALTVALLLPITFKLDPAGSLIMFAGIYYGGMYGGSTTAILINTPGESASMATALEGNKMAKAGRGGPALATAAIGSFVAGTHRHPRHRVPGAVAGRDRGAIRAGGLFRADVRRLHHRVGDLRLFADPRPDQPVHRADARPGRHRQAHRPGAAVVRRAGTARRRRDHDARGRPVRGRRSALRRLAPPPRRGEDRAGARLALDDQAGLAALVEAVAARHRCSASRSARCRRAAPRSRPSCPIRPRSG